MNLKELDSEKVLFIIKGIVIHARKGNTTDGNFFSRFEITDLEIVMHYGMHSL